ncbi:hypothetical protein ACS0TY_001425 [Phlomoides rotata]
MEENQVEAYHENERQAMHKILDKYIRTCERAGVRVEKLWIEMDSIEKGIVQLISEHGIKWLGMGAVANKSYSRKMKEPKSKKAIHVCKEAPSFCHIWFMCKGNLVYTRYALKWFKEKTSSRDQIDEMRVEWTKYIQHEI